MIDRNTLVGLKHILAMDIDGLGQPDAFLGGLHWDLNGMWEKSGIFEILRKTIHPSDDMNLHLSGIIEYTQKASSHSIGL